MLLLVAAASPAWAVDMAVLAADPAWRSLLHVQGEVTDPDFYLAATGRDDPRAELAATLQAFQSDAGLRCRYPARWAWLGAQVELGAAVACPELDAWKQKLAADHLTLLFPAMYLQNPASMFGHTFLRLDRSGSSPMLAWTLSYAARPDAADNRLVYVYKGVFGGYPGVFSVQPYFQTVNAYGDIAHRDIREYGLNLDAQEIDRLLNHVWELRDKHLDYFFLRENCAWQLLNLLDVARPGLNLAQTFGPYAMPVDTVRAVRDAGLIESSEYRPARASRIEHMYAQLDAALQARLEENVLRLDDLAEPDRARLLELDAEIRVLQNRPVDESLQQRSQLAVMDIWPRFEIADPVDSHASARAFVAFGKYEQRRYFEASLRPALQDALDDDTGLIRGASLEALDLRLRYYDEHDHVQLQQLTLFSLQSLTPRRPWWSPWSYELALGLYRLRDEKVVHVSAAAGQTVELKSVTAFALLHTALESQSRVQNDEALYAGVHAGLRGYVFGGRWLLEGLWQDSVAGFAGHRSLFDAGYQWPVSRRLALRVNAQSRHEASVDEKDVKIGVWMYF